MLYNQNKMNKPPGQNLEIEYPVDLHKKIMHKVYHTHLKRQFKILAIHAAGMAVFGGIITLLIYLKENISTTTIGYLLYGSIFAAAIYLIYCTYYWGVGVIRKLLKKTFTPQTVKQTED